MKVIDLLNKIANGEDVPYSVKYNERIYEYVEETKWYLREDLKSELFIDKNKLNDEIEIIEDTPKEDKKIEKLDNNTVFYGGTFETRWNDKERILVSKLNEIIDRLNGDSDEI